MIFSLIRSHHKQKCLLFFAVDPKNKEINTQYLALCVIVVALYHLEYSDDQIFRI